MRCYGRVVVLAVLTVLCACGGGGSTAPTTSIPQANAGANAPAGSARSIQLGDQPVSATLPVVSQIFGTLLFPAVPTPTTILLSGSATAPAGVVLQRMRRAQSGTLTVYEYVTIVSPITISLPNLPAMTLQFPSSTPLAGKTFFYGISDLNAQGGLVSFNTQGPGTIAGQTVSFAQVPTPITFEAGHRYTFVVYATGTAVQAGATKIYVANAGRSANFTGSVTTYNADGTQTTPTITTGLSAPSGIATDAAGKIYVTNYRSSTVTTYKPDGTRTTPTITTQDSGELISPYCITVDAAGKIYVISLAPGLGIYSAGTWLLTTYRPDGTQTTPTKAVAPGGLAGPSGVAVDAAGKIYIAISSSGGSSVNTYSPDGTPTTPTINIGLGGIAAGVAVDAGGKIHVATSFPNTVMTYQPDGTPIAPTITGLSAPIAIALDVAGKIYVLNNGSHSDGKDSLMTYNPDGSPSTPKITTGLDSPVSVAVH